MAGTNGFVRGKKHAMIIDIGKKKNPKLSTANNLGLRKIFFCRLRD